MVLDIKRGWVCYKVEPQSCSSLDALCGGCIKYQNLKMGGQMHVQGLKQIAIGIRGEIVVCSCIPKLGGLGV